MKKELCNIFKEWSGSSVKISEGILTEPDRSLLGDFLMFSVYPKELKRLLPNITKDFKKAKPIVHLQKLYKEHKRLNRALAKIYKVQDKYFIAFSRNCIKGFDKHYNIKIDITQVLTITCKPFEGTPKPFAEVCILSLDEFLKSTSYKKLKAYYDKLNGEVKINTTVKRRRTK